MLYEYGKHMYDFGGVFICLNFHLLYFGGIFNKTVDRQRGP